MHFWLQVKTLSWQLPNVLSCESQPSAHSAVKLEAKAKRGACRRSALRSLRDGFQKTPNPTIPLPHVMSLAYWQAGSLAVWQGKQQHSPSVASAICLAIFWQQTLQQHFKPRQMRRQAKVCVTG